MKAYHKVLKREGLESTTPTPSSSSKGLERAAGADEEGDQHLPDHHDQGSVGDEAAASGATHQGVGVEGAKKGKGMRGHRQPKPDPFLKAQTRALEEREKVEDERRKREERERMLKRNTKQRRAKHKEATRKTKRGQPIMKNSITSLLEKIQRST